MPRPREGGRTVESVFNLSFAEAATSLGRSSLFRDSQRIASKLLLRTSAIAAVNSEHRVHATLCELQAVPAPLALSLPTFHRLTRSQRRRDRLGDSTTEEVPGKRGLLMQTELALCDYRDSLL